MRDKPSPELMRALETLGKRPVQPPATPQEPEQPVKGYTLQGLSNYFGWGLRDDRAIWRFIHERESLLRLCQSLLGTEKSKAQTAELAIRERIAALSVSAVQVEDFWREVERSYDIEPRAFFEKEAGPTGYSSAVAMAVHHMWKRDVKDRGGKTIKARASTDGQTT